jgi:hypothetical protein
VSFEPKLWVRVRSRDGRWRHISLEELFHIVALIVHCENVKYLGKINRPPSILVRNCLLAAADFADSYGADRTPSPEDFEAVWRAWAPDWKLPAHTFEGAMSDRFARAGFDIELTERPPEGGARRLDPDEIKALAERMRPLAAGRQ